VAEGWTEQTQALTQAWIEAQTKLWSDWAASAVKLGATPVAGVGDWSQQWQDVARRSLAAWTQESDGVPRQVIERLFTGEEAFLGFVDMTLGMLRVIAPKIDAGDEWMELLRQFVGQIKQDTVQGTGVWMQPEQLPAAAGEVSELWRLYVAQLERLYGPWAAAYRDAAMNLTEAARGDRSATRRMYGGFLDAFETTFGRVLAAPAIGYTRETTERLRRGFDAWVEANRASVDFQTEMANTGFHAMEELMRALVEMSERGEQITSLHQFYELWLETAEKAYYELFGTDSFATLQGRFVTASLQYRRRQGELLDELMETIGLPGRKEVDEVHRHVYDLRIELRYAKRDMAALRRELEALRASGEEPARGAGGAAEAKTRPASPGTTKAGATKAGATKAKPRARARKRGAAGSRPGTSTG
jgi:class III poly(R)-hydroxyalkanoic acid synthase PhaE subunit